MKRTNMKTKPETNSNKSKSGNTVPMRRPRSESSNNNSSGDMTEEPFNELAKGLFLGVESAIDEARNLDCDVTEAEVYLEKGYEQFKQDNFDYADNYCQLALKAAQDSTKKYRTEELFHEIARIIQDNTVLYPNIDEIENSYRRAESLFEQGNFDDASKILYDIKNDAIDLIFQNIVQDSENKLQQLAEKIRTYRRKKLDVNPPTKLLVKANEAFDRGDYLHANELADEALKMLHTLAESDLKEQASEIISKIDGLKATENIDKDALEDGKLFFESMQESYKSGNYEDVIEREQELSEIVERIIKIGKLTEFQQLQERLNGLETKMVESKGLGIDVSEIEEVLEGVQAAIDKKDYDKTRVWLHKAQELNEVIMDKYMEKKVQTIVYSAQSLINEISEIGANIDDAEKRLNKSKKLLEDQDYEESRKLAEQTIIISREILLDHLKSNAEDMMKKSIETLKDLKSRKVNCSDLEKIIAKARESSGKKDYTSTIETLKSFDETALKLLNKNISKQVMESLMQFEEKIDQAREFDLPVEEFVSTLEGVKKKLEVENYQDADKIISKSLEDLNNNIKDLSLRKKLNEILADIETTRNLGAGVKRFEAMRERGMGALNKGNLDQAESFIEKLYVATKKNLKETLALQVGKQLRNLENKIKAMKERKTPIPEIEVTYNDAIEALRNRDYKQALKHITKGDDLIDEILQENKAIKLIKELDSITAKIDEAKIDGLDVESLETDVDKVKHNIEEGDFSQSKLQIRQLDKSLDNLKELKKVNNLLKEIETDLKETADLGVNVSKLERAYKQALKAKNRNELKNALDIARDINSILSMIKKDRLRNQAKDIFGRAEFGLKKLKEQRIEITGSEDLFLRAQEALGRNQFDECIKLSRQIEGLITKHEKQIMINNIQRKIEVFEFELSQAKAQGLETKQYEKSLSDIKTLLDEGKPNPALDVFNLAQRNFQKAYKSGKLKPGFPGSMEAGFRKGLKDRSDSASITATVMRSDGEEKQGKLKSVAKITMNTERPKLPESDELGTNQRNDLDMFNGEMEMPSVVKETEHQGPPAEASGDGSISEKWILESFTECKEELDKIKNSEKDGMKVDKSQLESLINATEIALKEPNLKAAKKFLDESLNIIETTLKPKRLLFVYKKLKMDIDDLWSTGSRIEKAESILSMVRKSIDEKKFIEADRLLFELNSIVSRFRDERLRKEVNEKLGFAEKRLISLSRLGLEEDAIKNNYNLLMNSKKELESGNVSTALDSVTNILTAIEKLDVSYWESKLKKEQKEIDAMLKAVSSKDPKLLTKKQLEVIEKAKRHRDNKAYRKAYQTLQGGRGILEKQMEKLKITIEPEPEPEPETSTPPEPAPVIESELVKPEAKPELSEKDEVKGKSIKEEKEPLEKEVSSKRSVADKAAKKPETSPPRSISGKKGVIKDPETDSRSLITDVVLLLQKINKENLDSSEPTRLLQTAKEEFICKNYTKANELAQQARNAIINIDPKLFGEQAKQDIEDLTLFFKDLKEIGVETEPLERNMKLIKDDFKSKEYLKVHDACEKLADKAKRLKTEFLKVTLRPNIHELMDKATVKKKKGLDITEMESYLGDADNSVSEQDFEGACQLYRKALKIYDDMPDGEDGKHEEVTKKFKELKSAFEKSRNYELDLNHIEKLLHASEKDILQKDYDNASAGIDKTFKELSELLKQYTGQKVNSIELEIEDISWGGVDTSSAMQLFEKGKKLYESDDYHDAIKVLVSAERIAEDAGDSFVKLFEGLRKLSREIAALPQDSEHYSELRKLRNQTKKKLDEKDYTSALGLLNRAMTLLRNAGRDNDRLLNGQQPGGDQLADTTPAVESALKNTNVNNKKNEINIKFELPDHNVALEGGVINLFIHNSGKKIYRKVEGNCIMLSNESPVQKKNFEVDDLMPHSDYRIALPMDAVKNFERDNLYQLKIELSDIEGLVAVTGIDINT